VKRFPLELPLELHTEFLRSYPDYGVRSALLRRCIKRLIANASKMDEFIAEVADSALESFKGLEGERR